MSDPSSLDHARSKYALMALKCRDLQKDIDKLTGDEHHLSKELVEILTKRMNKKLEKMNGWRKVHIMICMKNQMTIEYIFTLQPKDYVALLSKPPVWFMGITWEQYKSWNKQRPDYAPPYKDDRDVKKKEQEQILLDQGRRFAEAADIN